MKFLFLALMFAASLAEAAGLTCTATSLTHSNMSGSVRHGKRWACAWTSTAGAASGDFTPSGWVSRIYTVPGSGGSQPSDLYDFVLTCSLTGSTDVLAGILANRSNANTEWYPVSHSGISVVTYLNDTCTFTGSNLGNTKTGTIYIEVVNP